MLKIYTDLGLDLTVAENSEESGIYEVFQRISSGRLKVFRTLANFLQQDRLYRRDGQGHVVKQNDLLMNCLRCLCVSGRDRMCTEERRRITPGKYDIGPIFLLRRARPGRGWGWGKGKIRRRQATWG